ncbi:host attachment protein [Azoarcus communis]|uniref:Host attachment protein n=1 Tax=Parazoarcus communis SWub3 = DSM 12120 TaxID=1121029 RepID=A0A323UTL3_9RHOO|nr:host attachment protein [Parazoarcus communis]NMG48532.1 host attachment protein [Parazoarcus communis]NMG71247.1 host attachment protein [Parazoarcus communis SWub3 = DSM 12120]PZA15010.1 host attachment protein [Azoarcus communis] [Parazoarcus communis SWub3 = DSM 12120]
MAITWILVANASLAKLYANLGPNKGLKLVKELIHPESRQKNADLVTDRPGSMGSTGGSMQPQTEPKHYEAKVFAQEIAQTLYHGRAKNAFKRAIIVAPPAFMGMLNNMLDAPTAQLISDRFEKDYTKTPEPELANRLSSAIYL